MSKLIAITGATCSGKTTLAREMVAFLGCAQIISTTTREARPGERHGTDYWFVTREDFETTSEEGRFVEETTFGGDRYGITRESLDKAMEHSPVVVAVVTPEGCMALRRWAEGRDDVDFRSVFLTAPTRILRKRLNEERPDAPSRQRELLEQVRDWRKRAVYDQVLSGRRAVKTPELLLQPI